MSSSSSGFRVPYVTHLHFSRTILNTFVAPFHNKQEDIESFPQVIDPLVFSILNYLPSPFSFHLTNQPAQGRQHLLTFLPTGPRPIYPRKRPTTDALSLRREFLLLRLLSLPSPLLFSGSSSEPFKQSPKHRILLSPRLPSYLCDSIHTHKKTAPRTTMLY